MRLQHVSGQRERLRERETKNAQWALFKKLYLRI